ncbi:Splicing factor 3a subunit 3 [Neofusicoccum parvum]|uniref:Splicing factor 3a subunit 3 n=2 Tax=Neofusicoccum parvum TaxID=310453 RepID=A0ACB5RZL5_9PEZI|nr:putative splicing factor 3a subunit 3 protein [Neofusicoccum parvum UCRNP2]GME25956.1 Splicing factor 3a subunit 3 [Neofusicoccum parvum]GME65809.1 Splicing factor 3a subunit 3 [Neofusicoccum parvum]
MSILLEEQRLLHEDIERLEQATAERLLEEPRYARDQLRRDHQIANYISRIQGQSKRLLDIYADKDGERTRQIQSISTGDIFDEFYKEYQEIKTHHKNYPNETVDNLERAYKRRQGEPEPMAPNIEAMFTGEEGFGRFFDMTTLHENYLNLPGIKENRRVSYLQYLDSFDTFTQLKRPNKMTDAYFRYLGNLASYLEDFMRRTRPLEDLDKLFAEFEDEFQKAWEANEIADWDDGAAAKDASAGPVTEGAGSGYWCADCQKEFTEHTYQHHLTGKKHKKNAAERAASGEQAADSKPNGATDVKRLKERAIAYREFRIKKLSAAMKMQRGDTRVNVERRQGMTERERQQELDALFAEGEEEAQEGEGEDDGDDDKIYNPLKLPLAWDGKPIPFWLYKLHGLGVEFPCEICGNFVYMGRRAFDKHFTEGRHLYGLKCLGITKDTGLYREIVGIEDAINLHKKIEADKKKQKQAQDNVVQMEDAAGNVMPEKVYYDLQKQGLL